MKKAVFVFLVVLGFSCGKQSKETAVALEPSNILENLTYTVDTVIVDRGDDIINLKQGITPSATSADQAYFFHYTLHEEVLSTINLNALKLVKQQAFEKEGPNGVTQHTTDIQVLDQNQILFVGLIHRAIFDQEGKKIRNVDFEVSQITGLTPEMEFSRHYGIVRSKNGEKYFSLPVAFDKGRRKFLVVDSEGKYGEMHELPFFDFLSDYSVDLKMKGAGGSSGEMVFLKETADGNLILSNSAAGEVYLFDVKSDPLTWVPIEHTLVPNKKTAQEKPQVHSMEELDDEVEKLNAQITFRQFLYDDRSGNYFRFARIGKAALDDETSAAFDVYLFAYDQKFALIGETKLEELTKVPITPFFKDGKLWSYVNVEDELGFAVMDFDF